MPNETRGSRSAIAASQASDESEMPLVSRSARQARARSPGIRGGADGSRGRDGGYHTLIDPAALGYNLEAIIALQVEQGPSMDDLLDRVMAIAEVEAAQVVTGPWDLVVRIRVRDHQHMRAVVFDKLWQIPGFRHSETMVSYETRNRPGGWSVALALQETASPRRLSGSDGPDA